MDSTSQRETLTGLKHIHKIYYLGGEEARANDDISLKIDRGEFVTIVGKSGNGKSALMSTIGTLDVPMGDEHLLGGEDADAMNDKQLARIRNKVIGFIFQQHNLLPELNILENVEPPLLCAGVGNAERRERVMVSLEKVNLSEKWKSMPNQLSGGQQQGISVARAPAGSPSLTLADEPIGALDLKTSRDALGSPKQLNNEGSTIVMITHDNAIVTETRRMVRIRGGQISFDGDIKDCATII